MSSRSLGLTPDGGPDPFQLSSTGAAVPMKWLLHFVVERQSQRTPQGKRTFVPLPRAAMWLHWHGTLARIGYVHVGLPPQSSQLGALSKWAVMFADLSGTCSLRLRLLQHFRAEEAKAKGQEKLGRHFPELLGIFSPERFMTPQVYNMEAILFKNIAMSQQQQKWSERKAPPTGYHNPAKWW